MKKIYYQSSQLRYYHKKKLEKQENEKISYDTKLSMIENEIKDRIKELINENKITFIPTLEEKIKRWYVQIDDEHDEDILEANKDEYYKDESYKCSKCKIIKPRNEFYHNRKSKKGVGYSCIKCEKGI
jgi:hypothetical protein